MMVHIPGEAPQYLRPQIDAFLQELRARGFSVHTLRGYGWHLYRFARWLESEQGVKSPAQGVTRENILAWIGAMWEHYQPSTIKQGAQALRAWVHWLCQQEVLPKDFSRDIPVPKVGISPQRTLKPEEVKHLFDVCNPDTPKGARDLAMMAVLLDTGLRASELIQLRLSDWDAKQRRITVLGKGRRKAYVWCSVRCSSYIQRWLRFRAEVAHSDENHLFVAIGGYTPGKALTARGLRLILWKLGKAAQVDHVHPHAFRRSFTVMTLQAGVPTRVLQIMGRWQDLKMVERYSQALLAEEAWKMAQGKTPLALLQEED